MRNNAIIEEIASRSERTRFAHVCRAAFQAEQERNLRMLAQIGPPKPFGWWVYPKPESCDSGLRNLRDRCYSKLRAKQQGYANA